MATIVLPQKIWASPTPVPTAAPTEPNASSPNLQLRTVSYLSAVIRVAYEQDFADNTTGSIVHLPAVAMPVVRINGGPSL
jgi:hypothetical protein